MKQKRDTKEFVELSKKRHGDLYDYSKTFYKGAREKVKIRCLKHNNEFEIRATNFLSGIGCYYCGKEKTIKSKLKPFDYFLDKANKIHGSLYTYVKDTYKGISCKLDIICKKHGLFKQKPGNHLRGAGVS